MAINLGRYVRIKSSDKLGYVYGLPYVQKNGALISNDTVDIKLWCSETVINVPKSDVEELSDKLFDNLHKINMFSEHKIKDDYNVLVELSKSS